MFLAPQAGCYEREYALDNRFAISVLSLSIVIGVETSHGRRN